VVQWVGPGLILSPNSGRRPCAAQQENLSPSTGEESIIHKETCLVDLWHRRSCCGFPGDRRHRHFEHEPLLLTARAVAASCQRMKSAESQRNPRQPATPADNRRQPTSTSEQQMTTHTIAREPQAACRQQRCAQGSTGNTRADIIRMCIYLTLPFWLGLPSFCLSSVRVSTGVNRDVTTGHRPSVCC